MTEVLYRVSEFLFLAAALIALFQPTGFFRFLTAVAMSGVIAFRVAWWFGFMSLVIMAGTAGHALAANDYLTWNPSDKGSTTSLSNGDLTSSSPGGADSVRAFNVTTPGKYYWEITVNSVGVGMTIGVATGAVSMSSYFHGQSGGGGYHNNDGNFYGPSACSGNKGSYGAGAVIGVALNTITGDVWFSKNGSWSGDPAAGTGRACFGLVGAMPAWTGAGTITANFGDTAFAYAAPAGFQAGWFNEVDDPPEPETRDLSALFALQSFSIAAFVLEGAVLGLVFWAGIKMGRRS